MSDCLPPNAAEAEQAVLGCMLEDLPLCVPIVRRERISARHFYDGRYSALYSVLLEVHSEGVSSDDLLVLSRLKSAKVKLDLTDLAALRGCIPSAHNLEYYLPDLKGAFRRRELVQMAAKATQIATDPTQDLSAVSDRIESFRKYIQRQCGSDDLPPIVSASEFMAEELPDAPEVIGGVLHKGSKLVLSGASKAKKTWLFVDLAVSSSSGERWLGLDTWKGRVLYLNTELTPRTFQKRLRYVCNAKKVSAETLELDLWHLRGKTAPCDVIIPKIRARVKDSGYVLIIVDPLYRLYGSLKENSAEDMGILTNALGELAEESGAALAIATHHSKGAQAGKEAIDRISGSGVIARDADALIDFTANEVADAFSVSMSLRDFKPVPEFGVRWEFPLFGRDDAIDPSRVKVKAGRPKTIDPRQLLDVIRDRTADNPISVAEWALLSGVKRPTLHENLGMFRRNGWISTIGDGMKARQFITDAGFRFLANGGHK